ncbi:hypothetical protein LOZ57_006906 [Ophidiomyces ophidiicola]|uniref:uncharacterized protein n=1 Tax=Ophidiomyces ophidiicola TaxID=1387563 RepID=UPI0020C4ED68|nr:uncharacterized protein LOZ57_006906 [Ophidiomyces ophidiicola]KAI1935313.1 hypothetical protein LOZ57_006906 [Ophidiomyces ophidiicola]
MSSLVAEQLEKQPTERHPYSTYAVYLTTLNPPAIILDSGLLWMCHRATQFDPVLHRRYLQLLLLWMLFTKFAKFFGYFRRNPFHIILIPISILFGYFHGIIKVYAACTLHVADLMGHKTRHAWEQRYSGSTWALTCKSSLLVAADSK